MNKRFSKFMLTSASALALLAAYPSVASTAEVVGFDLPAITAEAATQGNAFVRVVRALPSVANITSADAASVRAARNLYNSLPNAEKANADVTRWVGYLADKEAALPVDHVRNFLLESRVLPNVAEINAMNAKEFAQAKVDLQAARASYAQLTNAEKANAEVARWAGYLTVKEDAFGVTFILAAKDLPSMDAIGKMDAKELVVVQEDIDSVRELYDALSDVAKADAEVARWIGYVDQKEEAIVSELEVVSVKAINSTQAVVEFSEEVDSVALSNFTMNNSVAVIKAEVDSTNKKQVTLTFNRDLIDLTTYTLTVDDVKSVRGAEMEEAAELEFRYEISEVASVQLTSTKFYKGDNLAKSVVVRDKNGLILDNKKLTIVYAATTGNIASDGKVTADSRTSLFVEIKVLSANGSVLATTGAVRVEVLPKAEVVGLDGIHIGESTDRVAYEAAKKDNKLVTSLKVSETPSILNVFAKDINGDVVEVAPGVNPTIVNLNPTVANVVVEGEKFVIKTITPGKASVRIKVANVEYTVTFDVLADSRVVDAELSKTTVSLDSRKNNPVATTDSVKLTWKDQYGKTITQGAGNLENNVVTYGNGSKLSVTSSNPRVATAALNADGDITIARPVDPVEYIKGSTRVTVTYKSSNGTTIFTKTVNVTSSDFESTVASYDLVITSENKSLDADTDVNATGVNADDSITLGLNQLDRFGNNLGEITSADDVEYTFSVSNANDRKYFDLSGNRLSFTTAANKALSTSGTVTVTATVGGVTADRVTFNYTNTDSVAVAANVNTTTRIVDLSEIGGTTGNTVTVDELLFGRVKDSKYVLNPALTVRDQFGATMRYNLTATNTLSNGVVVVPNTASAGQAVVTNLVNVVNQGGTLKLVDDSKAGSVTVVVPTVTTAQNGTILSTPVSFNVTLVK